MGYPWGLPPPRGEGQVSEKELEAAGPQRGPATPGRTLSEISLNPLSLWPLSFGTLVDLYSLSSSPGCFPHRRLSFLLRAMGTTCTTGLLQDPP